MLMRLDIYIDIRAMAVCQLRLSSNLQDGYPNQSCRGGGILHERGSGCKYPLLFYHASDSHINQMVFV